MYDAALDSFERLHAVIPNSAEVVFQVSHCYEKLGDIEQACTWFIKLVSLVPTDPDALAHLGHLFDVDGDKSSAFQYVHDMQAQEGLH